MRILTSEDGNLISKFDKLDETRNGIKGSSLNQKFFDNHDEVADRGTVKGPLP